MMPTRQKMGLKRRFNGAARAVQINEAKVALGGSLRHNICLGTVPWCLDDCEGKFPGNTWHCTTD